MAAFTAEPVGADGLAAEAATQQAPLTDSPERIRAFFAVALPERQRDVLSAYLATCARAAGDFRWATPDNLHLTLRFVGSVERSTIEQVAESFAARRGSAFRVALGGVDTFRRGQLARVVWIGVSEGRDELVRLASVLERACVDAGLEPEARAFRPHLTLARARPRDGATLPDLPAAPMLEAWTVREVILYSSHLGRAGAVHEAIRAVALSGE